MGGEGGGGPKRRVGAGERDLQGSWEPGGLLLGAGNRCSHPEPTSNQQLSSLWALVSASAQGDSS